MNETKQRKCFYVDKPCGEQGLDFDCAPVPWRDGKPCFPTAEEFVEHFKKERPHVTANQVRRWYANGRRFQISMYPDRPEGEDKNKDAPLTQEGNS